MSRSLFALFLVTGLFALAVACSGNERSDNDETLYIGGIPDQNISLLEERFGAVAEYLSNELGIQVEYVPVTEYASLVTAFKNGEIHLAWFGGLTGEQAKAFTPGSTAVAQRPLDQSFTSVFIVRAESRANSLEDLEKGSFTFGSTNSTSGHLMPRSFLLAAGIDPEKDFNGVPNFSGSHDLTWKLIESGSFDAGALNSAVWNRAVSDGSVDQSQVRVLMESPAYVDYQWVAHPAIDSIWGKGTLVDMQSALFEITGNNDLESTILDLFETDSFIAVEPGAYDDLEQIAHSLDMLQ
ncbi:MAG: putative selenate ABC transporter substrate-binding protein [Chloroflexi bacterium]|jgi:phosphonate transport system substrate-binding protein|nr:putative selenate ABC transporter substrate-binding protein [Chloroflexota bacterium]